MSVESDLQRAFVLIRQLQGALGGRRIVSGGVTPAGAVNYGEGFTAVRTGAGVFDITFTTPFVNAYALKFGSDNGTPQATYFSAPSPAGFTAQVVNLSGTHVDEFWNFTAVG